MMNKKYGKRNTNKSIDWIQIRWNKIMKTLFTSNSLDCNIKCTDYVRVFRTHVPRLVIVEVPHQSLPSYGGQRCRSHRS